MSARLCLSLITACAIVTASCSSTSGEIENAKFQLDKANYANAIAILEPVLAEEPDNVEAKRYLAAAYFGLGFLGDDGTLLNLFANYLEGKQDGKSNLESIAAVSPASSKTGEQHIFTALDLINDIAEEDRIADDYLIKAIMQLAVLSTVIAQIGALDSDDPCDYDFDATSEEQEERFTNAVADDTGISYNLTQAGIEPGSLGEQISDINQDLEQAASFQDYLEDEFGGDVCP